MNESLTYLNSREGAESLARDPYWPKWDSPWWRLLLAHEIGDDPGPYRPAATRLLASMRTHFIPAFFPEEVPPGKSAAHNIGCFCALGTMFPALEAAGLEPFVEIPWAREWLMSHALPDGGMNCDDSHYRTPNPGSSIVASVAILELFVESKIGPRGPKELAFVHGLAADLLSRKLVSARGNTSNAEEVEDEADWEKLCFPRFYFYDVLRGLTAISRYAERFAVVLKESDLRKAISLLDAKAARGPLRIERENLTTVRTRAIVQGVWGRTASARFPRLDALSRVGDISPALNREWEETRSRIEKLKASRLIKSQ